jgi:DNA-binding response OmpR family regulator
VPTRNVLQSSAGVDLPSSLASAHVTNMDPRIRIGVVEDHDDLRDTLVEVLAALGHTVVGFACAEDVDDSPAGFDLMLVDLNLPGEDGLSLVGRLKRAQPGLRVILITARSALRDRVRGYDAGADLYLPKPVDESELLAAVRAMTRQLQADTHQAAADGDALLRLDTRTLQLRGATGMTAITAVDAALLTALARAPGQRLEHWRLMEVVGLDLDAESARSNLAVRLTRLRSKLIEVGCVTGALRSVRGSGYQLCVPLEIG